MSKTIEERGLNAPNVPEDFEIMFAFKVSDVEFHEYVNTFSTI